MIDRSRHVPLRSTPWQVFEDDGETSISAAAGVI
jgi:hypothetical protein